MRRAAVLVPLAIVFVLAAMRANGPTPKSSNAPANEFSAARAMETLRGILAEQVPHRVGSAANRRVRERIEARFQQLGYETSVQRRFACNAAAICAAVENILARPRGARSTGDVVLLAAHYDSVGAGPGASDDGQGVATLLEVARAIRNERFANRVELLITDGEEAGLLGAEGFVTDEALARDVAVVVNVEMRGTYGASNMFETSRGNRWLVRHLSRALERPQASSLFYAIYTLLPNDTDVSVFKRAGKAAINFAAIRGVNWYHTPLDDLAHVSLRTLQHHGDNVLATLRVLGSADLSARSSTDATYFDVLGFFLIWWPQEWTLWIAVVSLVALIFAARRTDPRAMTFGVLSAFAAILLALLGGGALSALARLRSGEINFVAHPSWPIAAMWLAGIAAALFAMSLLDRKKNAKGMLYGVAIVWHMIGIALALTIPGAAFLFIVPAVMVSACALLRLDETLTSAIAATAGAIVMFPLGLLLYDALGARLMAVIALLIGMLATLVAPLFVSLRIATATLVAAIVCGVVAMLQPAYSQEKPQTIPLAYIDDAAHPPHWNVSTLTEPLQRAAKFERDRYSLLDGGSSWSAPAPRLPLARVQLSGTRNGNTVTVRVRTQRDAGRMALLVRGGKVRRVNGVAPPPRPQRFRERVPQGWDMALASGVGEMIVEIAASSRIEVIASDTTFAIDAPALVAARNASTAMTIQDGDVTITRARASF